MFIETTCNQIQKRQLYIRLASKHYYYYITREVQGTMQIYSIAAILRIGSIAAILRMGSIAAILRIGSIAAILRIGSFAAILFCYDFKILCSEN